MAGDTSQKSRVQDSPGKETSGRSPADATPPERQSRKRCSRNAISAATRAGRSVLGGVSR